MAESTNEAVVIVSLTSLRSSVRKFQVENGRTYHGLSSGKYAYPNDDAENDRLGEKYLQHYIWVLTLDGALCLSPKGEKGAKRALDVGTGTGIWAIEYADLHPESTVIGVDLSPIQPSMVPPNCAFEADDLEKEWTWSEPFDFIISRVMTGSFTDYEAFINKAYNSLEPGGHFEMQDMRLPYESDDGTLKKDSYVNQLGQNFVKASEALGRPLTVASTYKSLMEKAGFKNVTERKYKWPLNAWAKDPYYKEIGKWNLANIDDGMEDSWPRMPAASGTGEEVESMLSPSR
ncbi:S-adenosyl-L-methionine-dependent methyltransferase [Sodiomyces alkalinus F11]|uniref:S-adenosyl-L-methionine-dependent methyltransferase n=1 Tax=Sodiomyces alkalinus (strain CBS 110278 / VKM F-3762 / F11) TaxID=1314773 RepID=A0A3N2PLR4_SODAK|nr:S-adenosyl-L-methionine-dependent methyltransferase [Sodiomyces alkalinus F11]ROT35334.1 S-adenosyl-L-methionine-dependent methyltransferase [Sodiomyces alkalinus F11]